MAGLAHCTKKLVSWYRPTPVSVQSVRTAIWHLRNLKAKKYYDADNYEDGKELHAVYESMAHRGFCRPRRAYTPPENLEERLTALFKEYFPQQNLTQLGEVPLTQPAKVRLLTACIREFDHDIPNYELAKLCTLGDVAKFFSTAVDALDPYTRLVNQRDNLPENLHVVPNYTRFHPDTDTMFGGVSAYPGTGCTVTGLRTRKIYESWKQDPAWPYEIHTKKLPK